MYNPCALDALYHAFIYMQESDLKPRIVSASFVDEVKSQRSEKPPGLIATSRGKFRWKADMHSTKKTKKYELKPNLGKIV
jgi:hypothetical protein